MISKIKIFFRQCLMLLLSMAIIQAQAAEIPREDQALKRMLETMSENTSSTVSFIETRHSALLSEDIQLTGQMVYRKPDYLLKQIDKPRKERIELKQGQIHWQRADGSRQSIEISQHPLLEVFVLAYLSVLSGDYHSLKQYYHLSFDSRSYAWKLILVPKLKEMEDRFIKLEFGGIKDRISQIYLYEKNGDVSATRFSP